MASGLCSRSFSWIRICSRDSRALRSAATLVQKIFGRLFEARMMTVGSAASEGDLDHDQSWIAVALHEAIESYRHHSGASLILLKDFPSSYRNALAPFSSNGYQRSPSMPAARLAIDFADFEQYMTAKLSKVFRKNLRRKLRSSRAWAAHHARSVERRLRHYRRDFPPLPSDLPALRFHLQETHDGIFLPSRPADARSDAIFCLEARQSHYRLQSLHDPRRESA